MNFHLSASSINTYLRCPRQWEARYLRDIREPSNAAMLKGTAIYVLNGDYHEVQQDDFIYMAAYCPQFAFATGWGQMRYMVYKDVNRDWEWTL